MKRMPRRIAAVLVAVAEGAHASSGTSTVGGDRAAMLVAALLGLSGTVVAWLGARSSKTPRATPFEAAALVKAHNKQ